MDAVCEIRTEFGFERTNCACRQCQIWCENQPGNLIPADLLRLIPEGVDPLQWAEQHLRASEGYELIRPGVIRMIPSLVPAKQQNGHCHWYQSGMCAVHETSPFGCAFFDQHISHEEARRRGDAARQARWEACTND